MKIAFLKVRNRSESTSQTLKAGHRMRWLASSIHEPLRTQIAGSGDASLPSLVTR
jgi:hypothetical protein